MVKILNASFSMDGRLLLVAYKDETTKYSVCFDFEVYYLREIYPEFERLGPPQKTGEVRLSSCYWDDPTKKKYFVLVFEDTPNAFYAYKWPYEAEFTCHRCSSRILAVKMFLSNIMVLTVNQISIHNINHRASKFVIQVIPPNPRGVYGFGAMSMDQLRPVIAYPGKKRGMLVVAHYNSFKGKFYKTKIKAHATDIEAIAICSSYNLVATTSDTGQKIRVYFIETGVKLYDLIRGHHPLIFFYNTLSFSPDGKYLVADANNMFLVHVYNFEAYHMKCPKQKYIKLNPYKTLQIAYESFGTRFCSVSAYEYLIVACATGYLYAYYLPTASGRNDCIKIPMRFGYDPVRTRSAASSVLSLPERSSVNDDDDDDGDKALNYAELDFSNYVPQSPRPSSLAIVTAIPPASEVTYAEIDYAKLIPIYDAYKTPVRHGDNAASSFVGTASSGTASARDPHANVDAASRVVVSTRNNGTEIAPSSSVAMFSENVSKEERYIDGVLCSLDAIPKRKPCAVDDTEFSLTVAPEKVRFVDDFVFSSAEVLSRASHIDDTAPSSVAISARVRTDNFPASLPDTAADIAATSPVPFIDVVVFSPIARNVDVDAASLIAVGAKAKGVELTAPLSGGILAEAQDTNVVSWSGAVVSETRNADVYASSTRDVVESSASVVSTKARNADVDSSSSDPVPTRSHDCDIDDSSPGANPVTVSDPDAAVPSSDTVSAKACDVNIDTPSSGTEHAASLPGTGPEEARGSNDDDSNDGCGIDVSPSHSVTLSARNFTIGEGGSIVGEPRVNVYVNADDTRDCKRDAE